MAPSAQARSPGQSGVHLLSWPPIQPVWNFLTVPPMTQGTQSLFSNSSANTLVGPCVTCGCPSEPYLTPLGFCSSLLLQDSFYRTAKADLEEGARFSPSEAYSFEWLPITLGIKSQLLTLQSIWLVPPYLSNFLSCHNPHPSVATLQSQETCQSPSTKCFPTLGCWLRGSLCLECSSLGSLHS